MTLNQEVMEYPERRRREGRRLVCFTFGRRSSLFCVPVFFLYLCLLWVSVFFGFYVGPAKLQRGATPPSAMVLFFATFPEAAGNIFFGSLDIPEMRKRARD